LNAHHALLMTVIYSQQAARQPLSSQSTTPPWRLPGCCSRKVTWYKTGRWPCQQAYRHPTQQARHNVHMQQKARHKVHMQVAPTKPLLSPTTDAAHHAHARAAASSGHKPSQAGREHSMHHASSHSLYRRGVSSWNKKRMWWHLFTACVDTTDNLQMRACMKHMLQTSWYPAAHNPPQGLHGTHQQQVLTAHRCYCVAPKPAVHLGHQSPSTAAANCKVAAVLSHIMTQQGRNMQASKNQQCKATAGAGRLQQSPATPGSITADWAVLALPQQQGTVCWEKKLDKQTLGTASTWNHNQMAGAPAGAW